MTIRFLVPLAIIAVAVLLWLVGVTVVDHAVGTVANAEQYEDAP